MKKIRIAFIFLFVLISIASFSQKDALYYQYLFNYHILNPAFTGAKEKFSATLVNRNQWVGIKGAPHTFTFSAQAPLRNDKIALGVYVYNDRLGPMNNIGLISTYSYRIDMDEGKLSFGLQFGMKQTLIDWNMIEVEDGDDIVLLTRPQQQMLPDANFGIYYYTKKFFVGLSSKHLFDRVFQEWGSEYSHSFSNLSRHFYLYSGAFLPLSKRAVYKPSILLKYVDNGTFCFDLNSSIMYNDLMWLGLSYRSFTGSLTILAELKVNSKIKVGYSYDTYLGEVNAYNMGNHEIKVSYEFDLPINRYKPYYF